MKFVKEGNLNKYGKQEKVNFRFSPTASSKFFPQMTYTTNTECTAEHKEKKGSSIITMKLRRKFNNPCVQSKFNE